MIDPPIDQPLGALRIQIRDSWSIAEFDTLLRKLDDSYVRLASVMWLGECLHSELSRNQENSTDYTWTNLYYGFHFIDDQRIHFHTVQNVPLIRIIEALQPFLVRLHLDAVRVESPGWLQIVGNLNPLKLLADFITKWRAENTKRLAIEQNADVERERIRAEAKINQDRIRTEFAVNVIRSIPAADRGAAAERLPEIIDYAVREPSATLQALAEDTRVVDLAVVNPGATLPPKRRKRRPS